MTPESTVAGGGSIFSQIHPVTLIRNWRQFWDSLTWMQRLAPGVLVSAWWILATAIGGLKPDQLKMGVLILSLAYIGRGTRRFLMAFLPFILTGIVYDSQRFWGDYVRGP